MKRTFTRTLKGLFCKKNSLSMRFAAMLGMFVFAAGQTVAQNYLVVPSTANTLSSVYKGPSTAFTITPPDPTLNVQRTAMIYRASEVSAFPTNTNITSVGFNLDSAASTVVNGILKVYLVNTTDATFLRSTNWNTLLASPTAMTLVHDDTIAIPTTNGWFDVPVTPFNYTGGGLYLAYEWEALNKATFDAIYVADNSLSSSAKFGIGTTATRPSTLNNNSSFRAQIRLGGYTQLANDAAVAGVYTLGKLPRKNAVLPHTIEAVIINNGANAITNRTVTLAVTGANTFNATATIANLASGDTAHVYFNGFTPTANGTNTVTVTLPNDDRNTNNSMSVSQIVTTENISYATGNPPTAFSSVGITSSTGSGSGAFLVRYDLKNGVQMIIPTVRVFIGNGSSPAGSPIVGKTVFGVIMDANGNLLARSANKVLTGGDLDGLVDFQIQAPPVLQNQDVYVGLAVAPATTAYFPVGTQQETMIRDSAYYAVIADTSFSSGTRPLDLTAAGLNLGRFMIEAVITSPVGVKENVLASNDVFVYPNPTSGKVFISLNKEVKANTISVVVRNMQGQVVYENNAMPRTTDLDLSNLASGMYMLQVNTDEATAVKRLVIE
ncbi:MAG: T9SS type A sorting domain-containing protein [Hymenobacteraceae bacterium]|nr:T9SS type A sorting domain-containing protein [Hymenobacteraceae bacterium]